MTQHTISGVMVCLYNKGLLLRGPSGIGKSELALALISRGHQLVSDDALTLEKTHNKIVASAPDILSGHLNIREIGIINVTQHFGGRALCEKCPIDLIIDLIPAEPRQPLNTLPLDYTTVSLLDLEIPRVQLTATPGRNLALLVELATTEAIQREQGFNMNQAFITKANKKIGQPS
jgi:HPr kinase/phosphorylase